MSHANFPVTVLIRMLAQAVYATQLTAFTNVVVHLLRWKALCWNTGLFILEYFQAFSIMPLTSET